MNQCLRFAAGIAFAAALAAAPAGANDSSAELAGGGLKFVTNFDIRMESEVLRISPAEIAVDYVFRNKSDHDVTILVAFPLPDIDMSDLGETSVAIPTEDPVNFVDFTVTVDGTPVPYSVEQKAYALGLDVTERLKAAKLPLNPLLDAMPDKLSAMPQLARAELISLGIIDQYADDFFMPAWLLKTSFYWTQTFPAGKTVAISHRYKPVVGSSFYYPVVTGEEYAAYCIDEGTQQAAAKVLAEGNQDYLYSHYLSYILKTGRNWAGEIANFKLIIDKGYPNWLVSLCIDGITKTGPTTFEFTATDFVPERDLNVLFLEPVEAP